MLTRSLPVRAPLSVALETDSPTPPSSQDVPHRPTSDDAADRESDGYFVRPESASPETELADLVLSS